MDSLPKQDDIPVLTDAVERGPALAPGDATLDALQAQICAGSLQLTEELVRAACREAEHDLAARVMDTLRAELPVMVRDALRQHLDK